MSIVFEPGIYLPCAVQYSFYGPSFTQKVSSDTTCFCSFASVDIISIMHSLYWVLFLFFSDASVILHPVRASQRWTFLWGALRLLAATGRCQRLRFTVCHQTLYYRARGEFSSDSLCCSFNNTNVVMPEFYHLHASSDCGNVFLFTDIDWQTFSNPKKNGKTPDHILWHKFINSPFRDKGNHVILNLESDLWTSNLSCWCYIMLLIYQLAAAQSLIVETQSDPLVTILRSYIHIGRYSSYDKIGKSPTTYQPQPVCQLAPAVCCIRVQGLVVKCLIIFGDVPQNYFFVSRHVLVRVVNPSNESPNVVEWKVPGVAGEIWHLLWLTSLWRIVYVCRNFCCG